MPPYYRIDIDIIIKRFRSKSMEKNLILTLPYY
jgi:hypothetical protein